MGQRPGVSDDGAVAAFFGDHETDGVGIFVEIGGGIPAFKIAGAPAFFSAFTIGPRVGVNRDVASAGNVYTVAYLAFGAGGAPGPLGLYTTKLDITNPASPVISDPVLVVQQNQSVSGLPGTIQNIATYDPINTGGQLVFWVATSTGDEAILRAWPVECGVGEVDLDGDGVCGGLDNCPFDPNPAQLDSDADGDGDVCDPCTDLDGDGFGDPGAEHNVCEEDLCPLDPDNDIDLDLVCGNVDNCPDVYNPSQIDADGDSWGEAVGCDCDGANPDTYPGAMEVNDGLDNQCPGDPGYGVPDEVGGVSGFRTASDRNEYSWDAQAGATGYEVRRSDDPTMPSPCAGVVTAATSWIDAASPAAGELYSYLVRSTAPNTGSWGADSAGVERTTVCP